MGRPTRKGQGPEGEGDYDHDGHSDPNELSSLAEAGVLALEVVPSVYPRHDAAGNLHLYNARAYLAHPTGPRYTATTDVFFVEVEEP